jgi:signal transduction histidine kinase/response regulator of citrate/malate metabolism
MKSRIVQLFSRNINTKLAFVLAIIVLLCTGFVLLTKNLFSDFKKQQEQYRHSTQVLLEIDNLVSQFYEIQEYGNLFLVQKDARYLNTYQTQIDTFQQKLEQIIHLIEHEDNTQYFSEITRLLQEKKIMLKRLQQLFVTKKDVDYLYQKISLKIEEELHKEFPLPEITMKMVQDTVWQEHKSFGQRLRDAFRSSKKRGKNISAINTLIIMDTVMQQSLEASALLDSLHNITQQYQHQYTTKIEKIEIELYALLTADQYITREITDLLLKLHEDMLLDVISLGEDYEKNAQQALMRSAITGIVALLLITAFIIFIFRNIKAIRVAYKVAALEKQKAEELMESRHQLLLAISHDIKTPLNALLGYLELWENEKLSTSQLREINTMQYSGKYMLALLNNLLEFTRLEQQKTQITQENIEIVPFFMEIMEMFQPLCNEKNNTLNYRMEVQHHPQILIDSLKLKQITVNLISNAVKYTTKGEIDVRVQEICEPNLHLKITISDTGKGIPKEKLATLFEPFTRVEKNSSGIEGSGLGLFVVKGLVELLGGIVEIQTEEDQGTSVSFTVPFENVLENVQPVISPVKPLKIWIIEDDATQLQVIASMLRKLGHTAITSATKEAFENQLQTSEQNYDMVFTDLQMGDLNGYEVLQKIKFHSNLPVICLSGNAATSKTELQRIGFDDFLEKPFSIHQLEKILISIHHKKTDLPSNLFSLHTLYELFGNDKETIFELLNTFSKILPDDIQKLERAMTEENLFLAQQTAHKLLPFCKQINAKGVVPLLEKIDLSKKQTHIHFSDYKEEVSLLIINLKNLRKSVSSTSSAC